MYPFPNSLELSSHPQHADDGDGVETAAALQSEANYSSNLLPSHPSNGLVHARSQRMASMSPPNGVMSPSMQSSVPVIGQSVTLENLNSTETRNVEGTLSPSVRHPLNYDPSPLLDLEPGPPETNEYQLRGWHGSR